MTPRTLRGRLTLLYASLMCGALVAVAIAVAAVIAYDVAEDNLENAARGLPAEGLDAGQRLLVIGLAIALPVVLALGAFGGYHIAGRALGPLRSIADVVDAVSADRLDQRVAAGGGAEVDLLASSLNQLLARLEASLADVRRFTANAAHELRTPLGAVMGQLEVALRHPRGEGDLREVIGASLEELARMKSLLEALLLLSRVDEGRLRAIATPFDLAGLCSRLVERDRPFAEDRNVTIALDAAGPVVARGNEQLIERAVGNLLQNAVLHGNAGGHVTVRATDDSGCSRVAIEDDGPGVADADRRLLFGRFFRGDRARTRSASAGFGLGLSIARGIIEAHGGRVTHSERAGGGSVFTVELPPERKTLALE